jgi:cell division protein FtsZ
VPRKNRGGFDPERLDDLKRPANLVPRILARDAPAPSPSQGFTEIRALGVGGAGSNALNRMIDAGLTGVEFVAINTDGQALEASNAHRRVLIGARTTNHLGSGGDPRLGERAAVESSEELAETVSGADMVFVAAGMGGGTGTGASPAIAELAREAGALTVGVVTLPFKFEGRRREAFANEGARSLAERVDAMVIVHNERLLEMIDPRTAFSDAFGLADEMLHRGVQGITDLITTTGLVNVDFADVRAVMADSGTAMMGVGQASGEERALRAVQEAMQSPLLGTSIDDAHGVLLNITGGGDVTLAELNEAAHRIADLVAPDANIIFGSVIDPRMDDAVRVTLIATGFRGEADTSAPRGTRRRRASKDQGTRSRRRQPVVRELSFDHAAADDPQIPTFLRRRGLS